MKKGDGIRYFERANKCKRINATEKEEFKRIERYVNKTIMLSEYFQLSTYDVEEVIREGSDVVDGHSVMDVLWSDSEVVIDGRLIDLAAPPTNIRVCVHCGWSEFEYNGRCSRCNCPTSEVIEV